MACKNADCLMHAGTVVQEVVRRSRPGRGPLELSCEVRRDGGWELLYRWADQAPARRCPTNLRKLAAQNEAFHMPEKKLSLEHPTCSSPGTLQCTSVTVNRKPEFLGGFRGA